MAGVTSKGFEKKSFDEILNEAVTEAKNILGDDVDLRDETILKQMLVTMSLAESKRWDILEDIYNSISVTTATNTGLDYAVKFQGIRRKEAVKAEVTITISGDDGTFINTGIVAQTEDEVKFESITTGEISGGSVDVDFRALIAGADGNVAANTITELETPISGVTSLTNASQATGGLEKETDDSLRTRYLESLAKGGGSTANAIRATILSTSGVTDAIVFENNSGTTVDGLPPHSFSPYALGGTDSDIQDAIYEVKGIGIKSIGTLTKSYVDDSGNNISIGIERPIPVDIYADITVTSDANYPVDGDDQVQQAALDYIGTRLIGEDVIIFSMLNFIANNVDGITNLSIELSTDGVTYNATDITINGDLTNGVEYSVSEAAKVVVS